MSHHHRSDHLAPFTKVPESRDWYSDIQIQRSCPHWQEGNCRAPRFRSRGGTTEFSCPHFPRVLCCSRSWDSDCESSSPWTVTGVNRPYPNALPLIILQVKTTIFYFLHASVVVLFRDSSNRSCRKAWRCCILNYRPMTSSQMGVGFYLKYKKKVAI